MNKTLEALARAYQEVINPQPIEESHFKVGDEVYHKDGEGKVVAVDKEEKGAYYTVELENGKKVKAKPEDLKADDDDEDEEEMKEAKLDPVGQADADIDNDGDVDKTDKYLHNRRKAIKKSIKTKGKDDPEGNKGETAVMNPKAEQKEGTIRDKLLSVLEKKTHGKVDNKQAHDDNWSPGAKQMQKDHEPEVKADANKAADDNAKAEKQAKVSPKRPSDNTQGDKNIINPPEDVTKKAGMKTESFASMIKSMSDAYKSMYKKDEQ